LNVSLVLGSIKRVDRLYLTLVFPPMSTSRTAFRGPRRKLVLAFDVGTTYSGISYRYAILRMEDNRHSVIQA